VELICVNNFCVYFKNDQCTLDFISLDELGTCTQLLLVDIKEDFLAVKRKEKLDKFTKLNNYQ
jgi:hypothetical protein